MSIFFIFLNIFTFLFFRRDVLKLKIPECHVMANILTVKDLVKQGAVVPVAAQVLQVQVVVLVDLLALAVVAAAVGVALCVAAIAAVETVRVALVVVVLAVPVAAAVPVEVVQVQKVTAVAQILTVGSAKDKRKS